MPIYEYQCGCGERFERFQRSAAGGETGTCPACGKPAPRALSMFAAPRGAGPSLGGGDGDGADEGGLDLGGGLGHGMGGHGHGHSHGPGGHTH
jgi:putative FmdB family regulatory protein